MTSTVRTRFAAALSEHPLPHHAIGEVAGAVLERLGPGADLAWLFVTAHHAGALDDLAGVVRSVLEPGTLVGATAVAVLGGAREAEDVPAVALWAARLGRCQPVRVLTGSPGETPRWVGVRADGAPGAPLGPDVFAEAAGLVLVADPFSVPADGVVAALHAEHPHLTVIGGLASAARGPGGNRLLAGGVDGASVSPSGAVGVLVGPEAGLRTVVSQGCRPVGTPLVVTRAEGNVVLELAGQPPLDRLRQVLAELEPAEREQLAAGLHLGRVVDEHRETFGRGDFLVRTVLGLDRASGALVVADELAVGTTVQFHVRDAEAAAEDLRELLTAQHADGALVFTCNGRGSHLFGRPHADAEAVAEAVGGAVAGMFCAGEIGPVGGVPFLHGFTASVALFGGEDPSRTASVR